MACADAFERLDCFITFGDSKLSVIASAAKQSKHYVIKKLI